MKRKYVAPAMECEKFEANEYVAACITGTIQCVYPGTSKAKGDNGVYDDYNGEQSGWYRDSQGMLHGLCGYDATITFNGSSASGYEVNNGSTDYNRPIYSISGYSEAEGTYYVTWKSNDGSAEYSHKGRLIITNVDSNRPNHS